MTRKKQINPIKILSLLIIIIGSVLVIKYVPMEKLKTFIEERRELSEVLYVAAFAILPVFFFPVPVLALIAAALFGFVKGSLLTMVGAILNMSIMFVIARYIGRDFVSAMVHKHVSKKTYDRYFSKDANIASGLFLVRLTPIIPYNILNYAYPLTDIGFWKYLIVSFVGIAPGTLVYLNLGDKIKDYKSKEFLIAVLIMLALVIISILLTKYVNKKNDSNSSSSI